MVGPIVKRAGPNPFLGRRGIRHAVVGTGIRRERFFVFCFGAYENWMDWKPKLPIRENDQLQQTESQTQGTPKSSGSIKLCLPKVHLLVFQPFPSVG